VSPPGLSRAGLAAYALPAAPLAFLGLPLYVYLPAHYAALPGVGLTVAGLVLFVARLLDLATDPLVGALTDRFRRYTGFRAIILAGTPVLLVGAWWLFRPPADADGWYLFAFVSLTYLGWTLVTVPYYAWGALVVPPGHPRTRLAAYREGGVILGMLAALVAVPLIDGDRPLEAASLLLLILLPLSVLVALRVREPPRMEQAPSPQAGSPWRLWRSAAPASRALVRVHLVNSLANGIPATLFLLYGEQVLGLSGAQVGLPLILYFLGALLFLPLWTWYARRVGRVRAWRHSIVVAMAGFVPAAWLGDGDIGWFMAVCVVTGATLGADLALPAALQAERVEAENRLHGHERGGSLFGLWGLAGKLALALAVGISLPLLDLLTASPFALAPDRALPLLYAGLPVTIKLATLMLLMRSDLGEPYAGTDSGSTVKETDDGQIHLPAVGAARGTGRL